jgi:segregation and condensation protein A
MFGMSYRLNLDVFEGPFDLLLYLIKKNEIDIYDIPIASILDEFLAYVEVIKELDLDVAGDFILMGATLMHIKSRMLLPRESLALEEGAEADPRADLVRQLLEYKRYKEVAHSLEEKERFQREVFWRMPPQGEAKPEAAAEAPEAEPEFQELHLFDLLAAFKQVLAFAKPESIREIDREEVRTSQKMNEILDALEASPSLEFTALLLAQGTKLAMITAFLALLELARLKAIVIAQDRLFDRIVIRRVDEFAAAARTATAGMEEA